MTLIHKVLDLLEKIETAHHEDEITASAGVLTDLVIWAYHWGHDRAETGETISFPSWLRREARKYEASLDEEAL